MNAHEKKLRDLLDEMRGQSPGRAHDAVLALDTMLESMRTAGLEDVMAVFSRKQAELQALAMTTKLPEKARDMKADAARCSWAIHQLKTEAGRRKKPPRVRAKKEAK